MTLDDRLRTVLDVAADSGESVRAQYRQLVDLLGSGKTVADGSLVAAAFLRLSALARRIPAAERAEMLADPALRLRSPPLVAQLCEGEVEVAHAAIKAADLDEHGWTVLNSVLDEELHAKLRSARTATRARSGEERPELLLTRTANRASLSGDLTPSAPVPTRAPRAESSDSAASAVSSVPEIVARIERFRLRRREAATREVLAARGMTEAAEDDMGDADGVAAPPPIAAQREIDCTISPEGRIEWTSHHGPMLSGLILTANSGAAAQLDEAAATALRRQQSVRGGKLAINASPTISGDWRIDAAPNFDPVGRFLGHHARLTRHVDRQTDLRGDLIRQALHELRTPINALQGFSEIIQQQLFGPVPHQYRALAANIAGETAAILAGLDEVDRLVRLRRGTRKLAEGQTEMGPLLAGLFEQVSVMIAARGAKFDATLADPMVTVAIDSGDLERIVWRLLGVVSVAAQDQESISADVSVKGERLLLRAQLPRALANLDDDALYGASANGDVTEDLAVGLLGRGFALRLLTAEARAAGGSLQREGGALVLRLPCESNDDGAASEVAA